MRDNWTFHGGDIYIADLGYGALGFDGTHVQGPVVLQQSGNAMRIHTEHPSLEMGIVKNFV